VLLLFLANSLTYLQTTFYETIFSFFKFYKIIIEWFMASFF